MRQTAVESNWWDWRVVVAYELKGHHIHALELKACTAALRWRLQRGDSIRRRIVHFADSQVCLAVLVKGRSSSKVLRFILRRHNSLMLASSNYAAYAYVQTLLNPADRPSRWWSGRE